MLKYILNCSPPLVCMYYISYYCSCCWLHFFIWGVIVGFFFLLNSFTGLFCFKSLGEPFYWGILLFWSPVRPTPHNHQDFPKPDIDCSQCLNSVLFRFLNSLHYHSTWATSRSTLSNTISIPHVCITLWKCPKLPPFQVTSHVYWKDYTFG